MSRSSLRLAFGSRHAMTDGPHRHEYHQQDVQGHGDRRASRPRWLCAARRRFGYARNTSWSCGAKPAGEGHEHVVTPATRPTIRHRSRTIRMTGWSLRGFSSGRRRRDKHRSCPGSSGAGANRHPASSDSGAGDRLLARRAGHSGLGVTIHTGNLSSGARERIDIRTAAEAKLHCGKWCVGPRQPIRMAPTPSGS